ncbi:MAG: IPT/TIG domain-containing protein [Actinomycetota bacterium]|nr:IPT/TIG domain-containing protein [Actinomycetota bacterium]
MSSAFSTLDFGSLLNSVSCVPTSCFAVGTAPSDSGPIPIIVQTPIDNNEKFTAPISLQFPGNFSLGAATNIACATTGSKSDCYVLGLQSPDNDLDGANISLSFDPTTVSSTVAISSLSYLPTQSQGKSSSSTDEVNTEPQGLSCPTATNCVAIFDSFGNGNQGNSIDVMNSANNWTIASSDVGLEQFTTSNSNLVLSLTSIDCSTSTICLIGGSGQTNDAAMTNPLLAQVDLSNVQSPVFTPVDFSIIPSMNPTSLINSKGTVDTSAISCGGKFNCTIFSSFAPGNVGITSNTLFESYVGTVPFANPPTISSVSLSNDLSNQSFTVSVTGTNLNEATSITFGGLAGTKLQIASNGETASAYFSQQPSGPYSVAVDYPGGETSYSHTFNIYDPPTISSNSISNDISNQGFTLTINGQNLGSVSQVFVGSTEATSFSVASDGKSLTATFNQQSAGSYSISVTYPNNGEVTAPEKETIVNPPIISAAQISSHYSNQGFTLTINGQNLGSITKVLFGNNLGSNVSASSDGRTITAQFPNLSAGSYQIAVGYPLGQTAQYSTLVTILNPPSINTISPTTAIAGVSTNVVITGSNLDQVSNLIVTSGVSTPSTNSPNIVSGTPMVMASSGTNPISNYTVVSSTEIEASIDFTSPGSYLFELVYPGGTITSNPAAPFTILSPPQIFSISPTSTSSNVKTPITITGSDLNEVSSITIGGAAITTFDIVSPTEITFNAPVLDSGSYPVTVYYNGGKTTEVGYSLQVTQAATAPSQTAPITSSQPTTTQPTAPSGTTTTSTTVVVVKAPSQSPPTTSHLVATTTSQPATTTTVLTQSAPSQPQPTCAISGLCTAPINSGTYQFVTSNGQSFELSIAPTAKKGVYLVTSPSGAATKMFVNGSNFSFTNSSLLTSFPGGVELVGLSEQNGILIGHFIENGVATSSFTAKFVSNALFSTNSQVKIASIALSLPTPAKVFKSAKRDIFNILLAIILVLYISFTSEFFNAALGEKYEEFRRAMRRKLTASNNVVYRHIHTIFFDPDEILPQSIWTVAIVLSLGATIGIFLDPNLGFNLATTYSWLSIAISLSISPIVSVATQNAYRRLNGVSKEFRLRAIPLGLFIALIAVSVSRFIHFKPGYLYGIVIGVVYYDKVKEHQEGHISTLNGAITLVVGLVAWIIWIPIHAYTIKQTGTTFISFIDDVLASTFLSSIVSSLVTSLPLGALPGKKIFNWRKGAWMAFMVTVIFLLVSVAATPLSNSAASNHSPLIAIVVAVLVLGGVAIVLARIFLRIEEREEILEELEEEELVHHAHSEELESSDTDNNPQMGHE